MKIRLLISVTFFGLILTFMTSLNSCKKDPCSGITCKNGGTCANGSCNCPTGFMGSDCSIERPVISVTITQIVLNHYPMTTSTGAGWDLTNGPDVFLSINPGTSANDVRFSGIATDMTGGAINFITNFPTTLVNPNNPYTIGVWDYDTPDPDDFMGGIYFTPTSFKSGFPATINLSSGGIDMTLSVTWNF